jgi:glycosyltransferase involved in cell wall biosynthesis
MRVLHVISGLNAGGAEGAMFRVVEGTLDVSVGVVSLTGEGFYASKLRDLGAETNALGLRLGRPGPAAVKRLWQLVRRSRADVVQTWMYHADLIGGGVARLASDARVVWGVHAASFEPAAASRTTRAVARACALTSPHIPSAIICCSEATREVHEEFGYVREKLRVVDNGIDLDSFRPDAEAGAALRAELGIPPEHFVIGMVSRWDPIKDHRRLLSALASLGEQAFGPFSLVLAGDGMDGENDILNTLLRDADLGSVVHCLGRSPRVAAVMNMIDLHVLPSVTESFGLVTVEAMACGTPCIATDVGIAREIVGDTGWVIPHSDSAMLQKALLEACGSSQDGAAWAHRGARARSRVAARYGLPRMVDEYRAIWTSLR